MIYELVGVPASGKTYFLHNNVKKGINISKIYKENIFGKCLFHVYLHFPILFCHYNYFYKFFNEVPCKYNNYDKNVNIKTYIRFLIFNLIIYKKIEKGNNNYFFDEGIIHYLVALETEFDISHEVCIGILEKIKKELNFTTFYLNAPISVAFDRFKKRNRKQTMIDFLESHEIQSLLEKYKTNIEKYSDYYNIINGEKYEFN